MVTKEQIKGWNDAAINGTMPDEENPIFAFGMTSTKLLVKFLSGELDAVTMMRHELRNRGLNDQGIYVGFNQKEEA